MEQLLFSFISGFEMCCYVTQALNQLDCPASNVQSYIFISNIISPTVVIFIMEFESLTKLVMIYTAQLLLDWVKF